MATTTTSSLHERLAAAAQVSAQTDPDVLAFYGDLAKGAIAKDRLNQWGPNYVWAVDNFKRNLAAVYANCPHRDVREHLVENLWEEHGEGDGGRDHATLANRFGTALGLSADELENFEPLPEAVRWIDRLLAICKNEHFAVGLAAIGYGVEHGSPRIMQWIGSTFRDKYGIATEDLEFFFHHVAADEVHSDRMTVFLDKYADTPELQQRCEWAVREVADATREYAQGMARLGLTA
jgi:pyrroloquinoline-quinone synthase